jgi:DNA-binding IclR family transcriptional regulator
MLRCGYAAILQTIREHMADPGTQSESGVAAVDRAIAILNAFRDEDHSLALSQLSERTGLYKSTILRVSESLIRAEYLRRISDGSFQIGPAALRLASLFQRQCRTSDLVPPVLRRLVELTTECASFYIQESQFAVCLHRVDCSRMIRDAIREGDRLPIDRGAAAHVLRAFAGDAGERLDRVRADGFCASFGEFDPEIAAVSIPVFSSNRQLLGALTLSGPRYRFGEQQVRSMLPALRDSARALSSSFGGDPEWISVPDTAL